MSEGRNIFVIAWPLFIHTFKRKIAKITAKYPSKCFKILEELFITLWLIAHIKVAKAFPSNFLSFDHMFKNKNIY